MIKKKSVRTCVRVVPFRNNQGPIRTPYRDNSPTMLVALLNLSQAKLIGSSSSRVDDEFSERLDRNWSRCFFYAIALLIADVKPCIDIVFLFQVNNSVTQDSLYAIMVSINSLGGVRYAQRTRSKF